MSCRSSDAAGPTSGKNHPDDQATAMPESSERVVDPRWPRAWWGQPLESKGLWPRLYLAQTRVGSASLAKNVLFCNFLSGNERLRILPKKKKNHFRTAAPLKRSVEKRHSEDLDAIYNGASFADFDSSTDAKTLSTWLNLFWDVGRLQSES